MRSSPSFGRSSSKLSSYSRGFDLPDDNADDDVAAEESHHYGVGGAMLSVFLNDLRRNSQRDLVEVTLELDHDSIVVRSVAAPPPAPPSSSAGGGVVARSVSNVSKSIRRKLPWLKTAPASRASSEAGEASSPAPMSARDARRMRAKLTRTRSGAQRALNGLRFINKSTAPRGSDEERIWSHVESKFNSLAKNGLLSREDFGECIGTYVPTAIYIYIHDHDDSLVYIY